MKKVQVKPLVLGWPTGGAPRHLFMMSVIRAQSALHAAITRYQAVECGPGVFRARNELMEAWFAGDEPYFLMLDDDMVFNPEDIVRLQQVLEENPELGAVSGLCVTWRTGFGLSIPAGPWTDDGEMYSRLTKVPTELMKDVAVGAAFTMLRREAVEAIGDKPYNTMPGRSEDIAFAIRMRQAGWPLALEPAVHVGHVKSYTFYPRDGKDAE